MKMTRVIFSALVVSLAVGMILTGCKIEASAAVGADSVVGEGKIRIGAIMPITGEASLYGIATVSSIKIAIEDINKAGGINGKQLELIYVDDERRPEKSKAAYNKLVSKDKVVAIIGCLTSDCTLAVAPLAQKDKIPMITTSSINDEVTQVGDYIFRTCYIDSFQGTLCANFAADKLEKRTAAVVFNNNNNYSKCVATEFEKVFSAKGGTIVVKEAYNKDDKEFTAIIQKLKNSNPDILFLPDYYMKVSLIAKQVRASGLLDLTLLGGDGWDEIADYAGDEMLGSYYINHFSIESTEQKVIDFIEKYKAINKNDSPNALAALGYDAMMILGEGINSAGSTDKKMVRDAIAKVNGVFLTGNIRFDNKRNPIKGAVVLVIEKNSKGERVAKYFDTINP